MTRRGCSLQSSAAGQPVTHNLGDAGQPRPGKGCWVRGPARLAGAADRAAATLNFLRAAAIACILCAFVTEQALAGEPPRAGQTLLHLRDALQPPGDYFCPISAYYNLWCALKQKLRWGFCTWVTCRCGTAAYSMLTCCVHACRAGTPHTGWPATPRCARALHTPRADFPALLQRKLSDQCSEGWRRLSDQCSEGWSVPKLRSALARSSCASPSCPCCWRPSSTARWRRTG